MNFILNKKNIYFVLEIFDKIRLEDILICMEIQAHRLKVINPCQAEKILALNTYIYIISTEGVKLWISLTLTLGNIQLHV